ncbi:MAG: hypothetical protein U0271_03755 [Polyangiaceae bacterium]
MKSLLLLGALALAACGGAGSHHARSNGDSGDSEKGAHGKASTAKPVKPTDVCQARMDANRTYFDNLEVVGRAEAYRCSQDLNEAVLRDWLTIQAVRGGRKAISQLGLAELYLHQTSQDDAPSTSSFVLDNHPKEPGRIGKLLDEDLIDAQMEGRADTDIAYVHQRVRLAKSIFDKFNAKAPATEDTLAEWLTLRDKEPEIFSLAYEVYSAILNPLANRSRASFSEVWSFPKIPACEKVRSMVFKLAPVDAPMNATELTKTFNTIPHLGLLTMARDCAYFQGDPGEGDGFAAIAEEVITTARYARNVFASGDAPVDRFLAPFWMEHASSPSVPFNPPDLSTHDKSACWGGGYGLRGSAIIEADYDVGWGEVASRKDTPDGVLLTFKKASWVQDKWECNPDGSGAYFNGVSWEPNRKCSVVGKEKVQRQEPPTLVPADAAKEIKVGRLVSLLNRSSGLTKSSFCRNDDPLVTHRGVPLFVHSHGGTDLKSEDQVQYFFWPVKREKADKPAAKKP